MNIKQIKEQYTCLDYLSDRVVRKTKDGYLARCPWREDNHPSMTITANGKGWYDQTDGSHGNLIDMVMRCLNTNDLSRVCAEFEKDSFSLFNSSNSFDWLKKEKVQDFVFFDLVPLQNRALYAYLGERRINTTIARQFLREAHYSFQQREDGRFLFALAYPNDKGGVELRSKLFKGGTSPKGITTHLGRENAPTVVFEGFMDMLSFATLCGEVRHNYIVLNSIVNVPAAIEAIISSQTQCGSILLALDNDDGGNDATAKMLAALPGAQDIRSKFAPCKDINDYLIKKHKSNDKEEKQ